MKQKKNSSNNLLKRIDFCEDTINDILDVIIDNIPEFFNNDKKRFYVSLSDNVNPKEPGFNTGSCVIGRLLLDLDIYAKYYVNKKKWGNLQNMLKDFRIQYEVEENITEILPLKSFGILPAFSVSHLARFLISAELINTKLFKVVFLRLLKILQQIDNPKAYTTIVAELHPYLLNSYYKILRGLNNHFKKNEEYVESEFGKVLRVILKDINEQRFYEDFLTTTNIDKDDFVSCFPLEDFIAGPIGLKIENYIEKIEVIAHHKALTHLEWASNPKITDYDPAALIYALNILQQSDPIKNKSLIFHGLKVMRDTVERGGIWRQSLPFYVDSKARAIYVTTYQVAQTVTSFYATLSAELYDDFDSILDFSSKFNTWLLDHRLKIHYSGEKNIKEVVGWCSDDAPDYSRVDSWVIIHVFKYCIQQLRLLENMKKVLVLRQYSHSKIKQSKGEPWSESDFFSNIKDRNNEYKTVKLQDIKQIFDNCEDYKTEIAPVFLIYGPPGTSKTTFAEKISEWMKWDLLKLSPSDFVTDGVENIENKSREIFYNLLKLHKTVIVFDEMDSLFRNRSLVKDKATGTMAEYVIPAFLPKLQDLRDYSIKHQIAVFFITNYFGEIDKAIKREGRFDNHYLMLPLNREQRCQFILDQIKIKRPTLEVTIDEVERYLNELLNLAPTSNLLVYRENLRLTNAALDLISSVEAEKIPSLSIIPKTITSDFYNPQENENSHEEFLQVVKHLKEISELLPKEWSDLENQWNDFNQKKKISGLFQNQRN